jgi:hypothetical protein
MDECFRTYCDCWMLESDNHCIVDTVIVKHCVGCVMRRIHFTLGKWNAEGVAYIEQPCDS